MRSKRHTLMSVALAVLAGVLLGMPWAIGQQRSGEEAAPAKERTPVRNRLPMFYSRVVTAEQREQIYAIQNKYQKQIDELTAQLHAVESQRDEEIRAVLTPEQQKQIDAWMAELQQKRAAARSKAGATQDERTDADQPQSEPMPAPTARSRAAKGNARGG